MKNPRNNLSKECLVLYIYRGWAGSAARYGSSSQMIQKDTGMMGQKTATWEIFVLVSNIPPGKGARNQGGSSHTKWDITTAKDPGVSIRESIRSPNHQHCPKLEVTSAWPWPSIKGRHLHANEELGWVRVLFSQGAAFLKAPTAWIALSMDGKITSASHLTTVGHAE